MKTPQFFTRVLSLYLTLSLSAVFFLQLLLGHSGNDPKSGSAVLYFILFSIPFLIPAFIFSRDIETSRKIKHIWKLFLILLAVVCTGAILSMFLGGSSDGGWMLLGMFIFGGVYLFAFLLINILLTFLFKIDQTKLFPVLYALSVILIALVTMQYFGFLRPGLLE